MFIFYGQKNKQMDRLWKSQTDRLWTSADARGADDVSSHQDLALGLPLEQPELLLVLPIHPSGRVSSIVRGS